VTIAVAGAFPAVAQAHTETVRDRNDRPGRLDIRAASVGHEGDSVRHTITTFGTWGNALIGQRTPHYLALALDLRDNSRPERFVLFVSRSGSVRALYLNRSGAVLDELPVSRPNRRSVSVVIARDLLDDEGGYRWIALSRFRMRGQDVFDFAPNRGPTVHDLVPPVVGMVSFPNPSTVASDRIEFVVRFRVTDPGRSSSANEARYRLEWRRVEGTTWERLFSNFSRGLEEVSVIGEQGADYLFRVVARDGHGNLTVSPERLVSVPLDDTNPAFAGAFTGSWDSFASVGPFLQSLRTTTVAGSQFTYTFYGSYVAWIAPGAPTAPPGTATVTIDGGPPVTVDPSDASGDRAVVFEAGGLDPAVLHTIVITHQTGTTNFDGLVAR
jgi:hypothetical protein